MICSALFAGAARAYVAFDQGLWGLAGQASGLSHSYSAGPSRPLLPLPAADPSPSPSPSESGSLPSSEDISETVDKATKGTVDLLHLVLWAAIGAGIGIALMFLMHVVLSMVAHRQRFVRMVKNRVILPGYFTCAAFGGHIGLAYAFDPATASGASWVQVAKHAILLLGYAGVGWLAFAAANVIEDVAANQKDPHDRQARRIQTQAQVLRRVLQAVIIVLTIIAMALTYPAARAAMASVLASAGIASLIAGLAAQSTLANMFAGLQVAFADAIRVGDVVIVKGLDGSELQGTIEEITLTYVVVLLWDDRRMIVPSTSFTQKAFQNLTRQTAHLLGAVELELDWSAPVSQIRAEAERLLSASDLWDGRSGSVQVSASGAETMTVRIVASAENSGKLWDLRCYLREHMYAWLVSKAPYALPRGRWVRQDVQQINQDMSEERVANLAQELAQISHSDADTASDLAIDKMDTSDAIQKVLKQNQAQKQRQKKHVAHSPHSSIHQARLQAAKKKARRQIKRRSLRSRGIAMPAQGAQTSILPVQALAPKEAAAAAVAVAKESVSSQGPDQRRGQNAKAGGAKKGVSKQGVSKGAGKKGRPKRKQNGGRAPSDEQARREAALVETQILTSVLQEQERQARLEHPETETTISDRMFSGSPEAEERAQQLFSGPAENGEGETADAPRPERAGAGNVKGEAAPPADKGFDVTDGGVAETKLMPKVREEE